MALVTTNKHDDAPRGSVQRATAELSNAQAAFDNCVCLSAAGCATATVTSQVKTVNTATYLINGVFKSKGATDPLWTLGSAISNTLVAVASWQKYLLLLDATGTATVQEGLQSVTSAATVLWTNVSNLSAYAPLLSILNAGKAVIGTLTVATDATHTFTPGTTLLGAAGITATFIDGLDQSIYPLIGNETGLIIGNF